MKKITTLLGIFAGLTLLFSSCENYVQSIEPPNDVVDDELLTNESQVPFLLNGLTNRMATSYGGLTLKAGLLSDELISGDGIARDATYGDLPLIDRGVPGTTVTEDEWKDVCSYRFHADNFVERCGKIKFSADTTKKRCLFNGYLHGGIARQLLAMNFGLHERDGGGILASGDYIATSAMLDSAADYFNKAVANAQTEYQQHLAHSFLARTYLLKGNMTLAESEASRGLTDFDPDFSIPYSTNALNPWYFMAGRGRHQIILDPRFAKYIEQDSAEAGRIPIELGNNPVVFGTKYYILAKWPEQGSSIPIMTWQEVALIKAEAVLVGRKDDVAAMEEVNKVREAVPSVGNHTLAKLQVLTLDSIMVERDKQLLGTGVRLADQRRWNKWHWDAQVANIAWYFLPISQTERNTNKKLP